MQFFNELDSLVEQRWRDQSYNEKIFPAAAAQALARNIAGKDVRSPPFFGDKLAGEPIPAKSVRP